MLWYYEFMKDFNYRSPYSDKRTTYTELIEHEYLYLISTFRIPLNGLLIGDRCKILPTKFTNSIPQAYTDVSKLGSDTKGFRHVFLLKIHVKDEEVFHHVYTKTFIVPCKTFLVSGVWVLRGRHPHNSRPRQTIRHPPSFPLKPSTQTYAQCKRFERKQERVRSSTVSPTLVFSTSAQNVNSPHHLSSSSSF